MSLLKDFKGLRAIVRDEESGNIITETTIQEHDKTLMVISVESRPFDNQGYSRVSVLVISDEEILQFLGNVRKYSAAGRVQIALFKGKLKEDRSNKRFSIGAPAVIENLIVDGLMQPLAKPEQVTVVNISTSGALVRTSPNMLQLYGFFQLKIMINGQETVLNNCVMRTHKSGQAFSEYGCKFVPLSATKNT